MIESKWEALRNKLEDSRFTLSHYHDLMSLFADMNDCLADIAQIEVKTDPVYCARAGGNIVIQCQPYYTIL